jgi:hypothetical protein
MPIGIHFVSAIIRSPLPNYRKRSFYHESIGCVLVPHRLLREQQSFEAHRAHKYAIEIQSLPPDQAESSVRLSRVDQRQRWRGKRYRYRWSHVGNPVRPVTR